MWKEKAQRNVVSSKQSMSSILKSTEPVVSLANRTEPFDDSRVLVILRNMAGQESYLAVKRTAIIYDLRHHIAQKMWLSFSDVHLALDYTELTDLERIYTIQTLLEAKENVIDLLVDVQELSSLYFDCPNCRRECNLTECVDWSDNPTESCNHTTHYCCYGQFDAIHDAA